ncbi:hypothetical protein [Vibrio sp. SCSIO 43136]|uniref:hypothetical protein n=1 Tax=Vibrio sp. SCSIO 43136 TaxID=2819101 RepID=UPI0020760404|nr:hypothetical protein [Vibrio sp. SCSIO 43136]USD66218.1 hypothetical protein J4N39_05220 [Vibrio sp. SCSIO 43136]
MDNININIDELRALIRQAIQEALEGYKGSFGGVQTHQGRPLTEKRLQEYVTNNVSVIQLAKGTVVTPMARAKARKLGIRLTQEEA